jgi:hypothetical protein
MTTFIPYQVDFSVKNTAKVVGFSKKKVIFKFGFANEDACRDNQTGAQCRGSEHELIFVWSLASGKRNLFVDGKEVHYSESGLNGWTQDRSWQHAFNLKVGDNRHRVHFISQPKNPDMPEVQPFDLRVNGVSYFQFNKIFELGSSRMRIRDMEPPRIGRGYGENGRDSPMSPEERRAVAAAKVESLRELRDQSIRPSLSQEQKPMVREENLLSFDDEPPMPVQQPNPSNLPYASSITMDSTLDSPHGYSNGGFAGQFGNPPPPQYNPGAYGQAVPPPPQAYGYGQPQAAPNAFGTSGYGQQPGFAQHSSQQQTYGQPSTWSTDASSASSSALTAYQPPAANTPAPSPYALNVNTSLPPLPQQQQQQQAYGNTNAIYHQQSSVAAVASMNNQQNLSPSVQSYGSYGSAPSFAQPPPSPAQQQQQQQQAMYGQPQQQQQQHSSFVQHQHSFGAPPLPQQQQYSQQSPYTY